MYDIKSIELCPIKLIHDIFHFHIPTLTSRLGIYELLGENIYNESYEYIFYIITENHKLLGLTRSSIYPNDHCRFSPYIWTDLNKILKYFTPNIPMILYRSPILDIIYHMQDMDEDMLECTIEEMVDSKNELNELAIRYALENNLTFITKYLSIDVRNITELTLKGNHRL